MSDYQIGKVVEVTGDEIFVTLVDHEPSADSERGVPDSMTIHLPTAAGPTPVLIGQPGTFITVALPAGKLLCMVTGIEMREGKVSSCESREAEANGTMLLDRATRGLSTIPVGTIDASGNFDRGTDVLPTVNAPVFAVSPALIDQVYARYAEGDFAIGKLSLLPGQLAKINLDAFLTRHAAILGQTGGGKSWTVASLIQKMCGFQQATIVLFDLHGEYTKAFADSADVIAASDLELPYWLMNSEELLGLMVDRSESAAPNQIAKFKELLQAAKEAHTENKSLGLKKITIDTPVFFNFDEILSKFRELDTQMVAGATAGKEKQGPLFGQFYRLLMRVDSRLNDRRYDLIFRPKTHNTSASMEDLFRRLLGEKTGDRKKVVVVDLSPVPFDVRSSVISLILRCLFDFVYWHRRVHTTRFPISVFADEAHIYLSDGDPATEAAKHSAERIAKEGRKYGISLTVISQRPREVSATILSQCNSFLCLRISNPDDQSYVRNLLPDSVRGIASMFSTLRRGESILIGDSVMMPTRIKIDAPNPAPESDDASFYKAWNEAPKDVDFAKVLQAWRNQEIVS
ncbi:MAG: ATP-binding protein [Candidatus Competibacteraceae bacterium]|nr:ATP-binding protein [Candidatus Competibacteraceae bacterium]